jgi:hypothetical protein
MSPPSENRVAKINLKAPIGQYTGTQRHTEYSRSSRGRRPGTEEAADLLDLAEESSHRTDTQYSGSIDNSQLLNFHGHRWLPTPLEPR